jgi:glycosyltransferase involved in cell wall biosynthesis
VAGNILGHRKIIDKFVVPSDFLRNKLIDDGVPPHKISLIRNPVINITEANPVKEDVICYFGRFSDEKDLEFLIHAFVYWREKSSNNFKLILVGDGDKKDEIFKLISEGGYQNFIEMKPYSPFNELIEVIKSSKYFALTSKCYENFPMSVIESAALNIIPVVPNIGGMRESVEDFLKFGTTYEVGDIQSWGDSFNLLEKNYTVELEKLTERKDEILKHLYLENYLNALTEIYKNI